MALSKFNLCKYLNEHYYRTIKRNFSVLTSKTGELRDYIICEIKKQNYHDVNESIDLQENKNHNINVFLLY